MKFWGISKASRYALRSLFPAKIHSKEVKWNFENSTNFHFILSGTILLIKNRRKVLKQKRLLLLSAV